MALPKFLKLKVTMLSEDGGKTWVIFRQHFMTDAQNHFLNDSAQGMKLKTINGDQDNGQQQEETQG